MSAASRANRERAARYRAVDRRGWSLVHAICAECGKRCYGTRADAKRAGRQAGGQSRVYQCGAYWHLTTADAETVARYRGADVPP